MGDEGEIELLTWGVQCALGKKQFRLLLEKIGEIIWEDGRCFEVTTIWHSTITDVYASETIF